MVTCEDVPFQVMGVVSKKQAVRQLAPLAQERLSSKHEADRLVERFQRQRQTEARGGGPQQTGRRGPRSAR